MTTTNYEYWPFHSGAAESHAVLEADKVVFLETATQRGYDAFRFGINDYGARSKQREGCILERGRKRWEIRLAEGKNRHLLAYVGNFESAARAVTDWLAGLCVDEIVNTLQDNLTSPPGIKPSYVVSEQVVR